MYNVVILEKNKTIRKQLKDILYDLDNTFNLHCTTSTKYLLNAQIIIIHQRNVIYVPQTVLTDKKKRWMILGDCSINDLPIESQYVSIIDYPFLSSSLETIKEIFNLPYANKIYTIIDSFYNKDLISSYTYCSMYSTISSIPYQENIISCLFKHNVIANKSYLCFQYQLPCIISHYIQYISSDITFTKNMHVSIS